MKQAHHKAVRVVVCGALGRMGSKIVRRINEDSRFFLAGAVDATPSDSIFRCRHPDSFPGLLKKADVAIVFTTPASSVEFAKTAAAAGKSIVIGTTGFSESQLRSLRKFSKKTPVLVSPNMSPAVNLLFVMAKIIATKLPYFDVHIAEAHHTAKKDAPSGTALRLAGAVASAGPGKKSPSVSSIRAGDIVGDHTVLYAGPFERLELTHRAHSRELFAYGALEAAYWLKGKKPGLYDYQDVMGLTAL
ncbi:MAG: 4-hydroxy-tetrahydrodipicolinate reductase [bacterium]